jgi:hypothetical protein
MGDRGLKEPEIDMTMFKRYYMERMNVSTLPRLPQFSSKIVTTPAIKERLLRAEWDT